MQIKPNVAGKARRGDRQGVPCRSDAFVEDPVTDKARFMGPWGDIDIRTLGQRGRRASSVSPRGDCHRAKFALPPYFTRWAMASQMASPMPIAIPSAGGGDTAGQVQPEERAVLGSFCSFGRRMRWVLVGIMFRIISSLPKHNSRSPGSSPRFSLGLGMTVVPR